MVNSYDHNTLIKGIFDMNEVLESKYRIVQGSNIQRVMELLGDLNQPTTLGFVCVLVTTAIIK